MSAKKVIEKVLSLENKKPATLAKEINVHPTQIYDMLSGKTKNITIYMADKIRSAYSKYSRTWLITGEGDMYADQKESMPKVNEKNGSYKKISEELIIQLKSENETLRGQVSFLQDVINRMQGREEEIQRLQKQIDELSEKKKKGNRNSA